MRRRRDLTQPVRDRVAALNVMFKMYDKDFEIVIKDGAKRPIRVHWFGNRHPADRGGGLIRGTAVDIGYFETIPLLERFLTKRFPEIWNQDALADQEA